MSGRRHILLNRLHRWDARQPPAIVITFEPTGTIPFLGLPGEIRNKVYEKLLQLRHMVDYHHPSKGWTVGHVYPQILRLSREVSKEASSFLHGIARMQLSIFGDDYIEFGKKTIYYLRALIHSHTQGSHLRRNPWYGLPARFQYCVNLDVYLGVHSHRLDPTINQRTLDKILTRVRSLVAEALPWSPSLLRLRVMFEVNHDLGELAEDRRSRRSTYVPPSTRALKTFETMCLIALGQLRGMREVEFNGLMFAKHTFVDQIRRAMMEPKAGALSNTGRSSLIQMNTKIISITTSVDT